MEITLILILLVLGSIPYFTAREIVKNQAAQRELDEQKWRQMQQEMEDNVPGFGPAYWSESKKREWRRLSS